VDGRAGDASFHLSPFTFHVLLRPPLESRQQPHHPLLVHTADQYEVHDPPVLLREIPIQLLSDTWFGPSTREGELAYASQTSARLLLENLPRRSNRAVTPVSFRNRAESALFLERLSLPVPYLPLYAVENEFLWTPCVTLDRESNTELVKLQIEEKPPVQAKHPRRVCEPREVVEKGMLVRAFSALFG